MKVLHAAGLAAVLALAAAPAAALAGPPAPVDPQNWSFQDNLTWNDYKPLPGHGLLRSGVQPTVKKWKVALVVTDFPDKPLHDLAAGGQRRSSARRRPRPTTSRVTRCRRSTATSSTSRRR